VKLYLDANVIIFGHEADESLKQLVLKRLLDWCQRGGEVATSILSRLECRVIPLRTRNASLLADYDDFFSSAALEVVDISRPIIELATELRAKYGFKSPDAIHLASAIDVGAQTFLTADVALRKCTEIAVEMISPPAAGASEPLTS
jgi:predicted nucleic acid-binding protein